jgi:CelD/BcsL family acetyltransferase involved in cellulose biosynthesis
MSGTSCADVSIETFATTKALPPDALALLDEAGSVFAGRSWWDVVLSDAMPPGASAVLMVCRAGGRVAAVIPMLRPRVRGGLQSLTTPYSCRYTPVVASSLGSARRIAVLRAFSDFCRPGGVIRLDAIPAEWDGLPDLLTGARQAGLRPLRFDHFGNWHEEVAGLDWAGYLARRPGVLRETIRRRLRRASRQPEARFALLTAPAEVDVAAEAFETVHRRCWKDPEPYPSFNVALMRAMADLGLLRFALWSLGSTPVAVQLWVVEKCGRATILKLAHDEAFTAYSPGTVLTALTLRHLLDQEHATEIDFGRGDDNYKQGWAAQRRQRIGLLLVDPWRLPGALQLGRHTLGRLRAATHTRLSSVDLDADQPTPLGGGSNGIKDRSVFGVCAHLMTDTPSQWF